MGDSELADQAALQTDSAAGAPPYWDVRSAIVSEPQLLQLLHYVPAVCPQCQSVVPPDVSRHSMSYRITWVSIDSVLLCSVPVIYQYVRIFTNGYVL